MARRSLLTGDERRRLFEPPVTDREVARCYTLSPDDLKWIDERRSPANKLGGAVQMALLRHPGFGWSPGQPVPTIVLRFLADQVHVASEALGDYSKRQPTRIEHAGQLHARLGLRVFIRSDIRPSVAIAAAAARSTDKGGPIVEALIAELRRRHIVLPSPDTLERIGLAGRAQARRKAAEDLLAAISPSQLERIDQLLNNDPKLKKSPLAWLRDIPESPSAASMAAITERLAYVRAIAIDPAVTKAIHERRFEQYAREGAVAPAFLLSGYGVGRRRATMVAQLIELEARLSDAAVDVFDKMVGSLFARGRRGRERKYQASSREVSQLMRLFSGVIGAVDQAWADGGDVLDRIETQVGWWKVIAARPKIDALAALAVEDPLVSAADRYGALRRFAPTFLEHIRFRAGTGGAPLLRALEILRALNLSGRREVPDDAPLPFASKHWKALVKPIGGPINRRLYEPDCPGWNSSTTFPDGSSARICLPPGPLTMSLRKLTPRARSRSTSASMSSTMNWNRFQPPASGWRPSGIGRPAELILPLSNSRRGPRSTAAKAGETAGVRLKPKFSTYQSADFTGSSTM